MAGNTVSTEQQSMSSSPRRTKAASRRTGRPKSAVEIAVEERQKQEQSDRRRLLVQHVRSLRDCLQGEKIEENALGDGIVDSCEHSRTSSLGRTSPNPRRKSGTKRESRKSSSHEKGKPIEKVMTNAAKVEHISSTESQNAQFTFIRHLLDGSEFRRTDDETAGSSKTTASRAVDNIRKSHIQEKLRNAVSKGDGRGFTSRKQREALVQELLGRAAKGEPSSRDPVNRGSSSVESTDGILTSEFEEIAWVNMSPRLVSTRRPLLVDLSRGASDTKTTTSFSDTLDATEDGVTATLSAALSNGFSRNNLHKALQRGDSASHGGSQRRTGARENVDEETVATASTRQSASSHGSSNQKLSQGRRRSSLSMAPSFGSMSSGVDQPAVQRSDDPMRTKLGHEWSASDLSNLGNSSASSGMGVISAGPTAGGEKRPAKNGRRSSLSMVPNLGSTSSGMDLSIAAAADDRAPFGRGCRSSWSSAPTAGTTSSGTDMALSEFSNEPPKHDVKARRSSLTMAPFLGSASPVIDWPAAVESAADAPRPPGRKGRGVVPGAASSSGGGALLQRDSAAPPGERSACRGARSAQIELLPSPPPPPSAASTSSSTTASSAALSTPARRSAEAKSRHRPAAKEAEAGRATPR